MQQRIQATRDGLQRMIRRHTGVEEDDGYAVRLGLSFSTRVDPIHSQPDLFNESWGYSTAWNGPSLLARNAPTLKKGPTSRYAQS